MRRKRRVLVSSLILLVFLVSLVTLGCGSAPPSQSEPSSQSQQSEPQKAAPADKPSEPEVAPAQVEPEPEKPAETATTPPPATPTETQKVEEPQQATPSVTVYITKTGEKYHRDGCQYLAKSKIAINLEDAKARGYGPCSKCKPPQ